jgi:valyl-tRNA synthetase
VEAPDLLISAEWPTAIAAHVNEERETEFALVQEFVRAVRDLRRRYNIGLSTPISATIRAGGVVRDRLTAYEGLIRNLVNIDSMEIGPSLARPPQSATTVVGESEIYLEGLVDPEKERAKLSKQKMKLEKDITGLEKKLANSSFREKAPPAVVEKEETRLAEAKAELELVSNSIRELDR